MDPQFASNKRIRKHSFVRKEVLFLGDSRQESSVEKKTSLRPDRRDKVVPHKGHPAQQGSTSSGAEVQTDPPMDPQFASNKRIRKHSFVRKEVLFLGDSRQESSVEKKTSLRPDRRDKVVPHKGHPAQQGSGSSGAEVQTDPP
uniref:Uncharacterized protein n=1 Tax=Trichobilharzia regenti TaxID=157069 RepID=A0AA85JHH2_TRIRE